MNKLQAARRRVTAGEALYVLNRLLDEKRLNQGHVNRLLAEMHREIEDLEQRLAALRQAASSSRPSVNKSARLGRTTAATSAGSRAVTPELAKSRKLQGEYMGLIRHIRGAARQRMKKLAKDQGREAAVKTMRGLLEK